MLFAEGALAESLCALEAVVAHCGQVEEVCHS